jgi:hypothetical protein
MLLTWVSVCQWALYKPTRISASYCACIVLIKVLKCPAKNSGWSKILSFVCFWPRTMAPDIFYIYICKFNMHVSIFTQNCPSLQTSSVTVLNPMYRFSFSLPQYGTYCWRRSFSSAYSPSEGRSVYNLQVTYCVRIIGATLLISLHLCFLNSPINCALQTGNGNSGMSNSR